MGSERVLRIVGHLFREGFIVTEVNEFRNPVTKAANGIVSGALSPIERWLVRRYGDGPCQCVFIVGPPRTGSTLFYEVLVTRYRFAYTTGLTHRLFRVPVITSLLQCPFVKRRVARYESEYGQVYGFTAPTESGRIWRYWLPRHAPYCFDTPGIPNEQIRSIVSAISHCLGGPFLTKYLFFANQLELVDELFPGALFLHIEREPRDVVRSILRRRRADGLEREWWSVRPRSWERYRYESAVRQVCAQVALLHQDINESIAAIGPHRRLHVGYESLCEDPRGISAKVRSFLARHDIHLEDRGDIPRSFQASPPRPLDAETENKITQELARFGLSDARHRLAGEIVRPDEVQV